MSQEVPWFLGCIDDNFLRQMIEEPASTAALLDLIFTNKEDLVRDLKVVKHRNRDPEMLWNI